MALNSLICADVPLRSCSLTHSLTVRIFSDCAITKYLSSATARRPCGHQTALPCGR